MQIHHNPIGRKKSKTTVKNDSVMKNEGVMTRAQRRKLENSHD